MIIKSHELKQAMILVGRTANSRSTLPILGHVCIQATEKGIELATTNLEQMIVTEIAVGDSTDWQACTVDATLFQRFINELPDKPIELTQKNARLHVECGGFKANFPTMDGEDFPLIEFPEMEGFTIGGKDFSSIVDLVVFAASQNASQPTLNGINLLIEAGHATFAATDGTRLSVAKMAIDAPDCSIVIPAAAFNAFMAATKNAESITLIPADNHVWFMADGVRMKSQIISARYPNYQQIMPISHDHECSVAARDLRQALRSVQVLANASGVIDCRWESGNLALEAVNAEMGTAQAVINATDAPLDEFGACLNGELFSDIANRAEVTVRIQSTSPTRPIVFLIDGMSADEYVHIIMPMNMPA